MKRRLGLLLLAFAAGASAIERTSAGADELARKTPRLDPDADAEVVVWDVRIEERAGILAGGTSLSLSHYQRIKIYTERGREKYATVEIPLVGKWTVSDVSGRTVKADGTAIELKSDAVLEREIVKNKRVKVKTITFILPNVEAGDVIEYTYREIRPGASFASHRLYLQREIPVWKLTYHLKAKEALRFFAFQTRHPSPEPEPDGFRAITMKDLSAFKEEPDMLPKDQVRAWALVTHDGSGYDLPVYRLWEEIGKEDYEYFKRFLKAGDLVKRTAAEVAGGEVRTESKLAALELFCRTQIRRLDSPDMTAGEIDSIKENKSPSDTLKQRAGTGIDLNLLFAAMANAVGLDARIARMADRSDVFFDRTRPLLQSLRGFSVAVKVGGEWRFYDPAGADLDAGMIRWQEELQPALISDPTAGFFIETPASPPSRSRSQRRAVFNLKDDGTLNGIVEHTYSGHTSAMLRATYRAMTAERREEEWKGSLENRLAGAEISEFSMTDPADPSKPLTVRYKLSAPGYATRTGKRLLLQAAFFQKNAEARYKESERKLDLYFPFGWEEDDQITIDLPDGWVLDDAGSPFSKDLGGTGFYSAQVFKSTDGRRLIYRRRFDWGRGGKLIFPVNTYPQIKRAFDFVHDQDNHTVALKEVSRGDSAN